MWRSILVYYKPSSRCTEIEKKNTHNFKKSFIQILQLIDVSAICIVITLYIKILLNLYYFSRLKYLFLLYSRPSRTAAGIERCTPETIKRSVRSRSRTCTRSRAAAIRFKVEWAKTACSWTSGRQRWDQYEWFFLRRDFSASIENIESIVFV